MRLATGHLGSAGGDGTVVVVWITVETEMVGSVIRVVAVSESIVLIVSGTFSVAIACITELTTRPW